mgnify:CR=1 FL=1
MRKFKKIALLGALLMIAAIGTTAVGTTAGANAGERSVANTAVAEEGTETIADKNLAIANSTSFGGVRVSITGQVESDADAEKYARRTVLYAGLGEADRDLSEAESISVKLKFVTANSNRIFIVLADGTGNTAVSKFFVNRPADGKPLGSKFYDESGAEVSLTEASGSAWEGVAAKAAGTAGTLVCAKDGFYTAESMWSDNAAAAVTNKNEYGIADKTVTPSGTFDWSDVRRVMVSVVVWNVNTLDIGDISAKYGNGGEKTLFDASESERKTVQSTADIAGLKKDEWAFAPRLNYIETWQNDKGGVFENLGKEKATIVAAKVEENGYVFVRKSATGDSDIWQQVTTESGQNYGDITGYGAFVFDLDSRVLTQEGKIDFILRVTSGGSTKDYRAYGNGNSTENFFHYVDENGEVSTNSSAGKGGNIIPTGFNGKVIIPFNAFQGETESDHPTEEELKNTVALLMVFHAANFKASETVNVGKIKLVADFEKKIAEYRAAAQKSAVSAAVTTFCESFAMTDGAALRVKKNDYGLRFMVNLSANAYAALKTAAENAGVSIELGAILSSDDSLNGATLTKDNKEMSLIVGKWNVENESFFATLGYDKIQGNEGVKYTVRGYLTLTFADGSSQTVYTERSMSPEDGTLKAGGAISRSLKQVAEAVSLNENFEKEFADKSDAGKAYAREVLEQILGAANA